MSGEYPDDPKLTYALIRLQDELDKQRENPHPDFDDIVTHRNQVLSRFQPIFNVDHLPVLSKEDFLPFLLYKNNHHWLGIHRGMTQLTANMSRLREALIILLDEKRPIRERLNRIRPERFHADHAMVPQLGIPILTAILIVVHPDKYGVWNNISENGLQMVRLWDPRWEGDPTGDVYEELNPILLQLSHYLKIDLWTLDALWWMFKK
jgi:hypothetical protein